MVHQYGTNLKSAELQDIKIQKVGTAIKLSKTIKITTQNIKKDIYNTENTKDRREGWTTLKKIKTNCNCGF